MTGELKKTTELELGTPVATDVYAYVSDPGGTPITKKALVSMPAPATTAANDFQVGNGSGSWIKKTLAEVLTILLNKASGAEIITGTDDAKWATPKAIKDAGIVPVKMINGVPHRQFWIGNAKPTLTNGCSASAQIEMATNKNVYDYLAFDASTVESAYANVNMPEDYTGGVIYAQFKWLHPATTTNFKVSWGLSAVCFADDDTLDAAMGTMIYSNDTGGTTSDFYSSPQTAAITIAGTPAASVYTKFRITRQADDAVNDTLAVDAYLLGVTVWYPVG